MRLLCLLIGSVLIACAGARTAWADSVVIVLDRGAGAKERAKEYDRVAQRLAERLQARGDTFKAYAVGARANGKPRVVEIPGPIEDLAGKEGVSFEGPSDARAALAAAIRGPTPTAPVTVVLIGPFGRVDPVPEGTGFALETWNRTAPAGSALIPFGLSDEARKLLEGAKGWRPHGVVVLGLESVNVTPEPWSAFEPDVRLRAHATATLDVIRWPSGLLELSGDGAFAVLTLSALGTEGDTFVSDGAGGLILARAATAGLGTTVRLSVTGDGSAWNLASAGSPLPVRWVPKPELRWLTPDGAPPRFEALDLERGVPREARYRYRRSVHPQHPELGRPPPEWEISKALRMRSEPEREIAPAVFEGALVAVATFQEDADRWDETGEESIGPAVQTGAERIVWDTRIEVRYHLRSAPGHVRARLTAPEGPQALPPASTDKPWELLLFAENKNAPESVSLRWHAKPGGADSMIALRVRRGDAEESVWLAGETRAFAVGVPFQVRVVSRDDHMPPWTGMVTLEAVPKEHVEVTLEGEGNWRGRKPRLLVEPGEVRYRANAKDVTEEAPLRLRLDADGGDGEWLAELLERTPNVLSPRGSPQAFAVVRVAPGRWEVRRAGAWSGERAGIFQDREERLPLMVRWDEGAGPTEVAVPVTVPARWGRMGWVLVGLAGLAVLLGFFVVLSHRALPLTGTLLYTVEGRAGAVGRLALAPVGRRAITVTADERGRLALGGAGTALFRLLPTRVGGMAEVPAAGGTLERRLLVDGLAFSVGRHALRYVQTGNQESTPPVGALSPSGGTVTGTTSAPDLLGPEYDLPHGA